jgi:hypothetical protein
MMTVMSVETTLAQSGLGRPTSRQFIMASDIAIFAAHHMMNVM